MLEGEFGEEPGVLGILEVDHFLEGLVGGGLVGGWGAGDLLTSDLEHGILYDK